MNKKLLLMATIVATLGLTGCGDKDQGKPDIIPVEDMDKDQVGDSKEDVKDEVKEENTTMTDDEMIEKSDYIAKVKTIEKGQGNLELKVLDNIKGNITADKIPNAESLEKHRTYLVFLEDQDGKVETTNGKESFIILEGDNHEIFEKINKEKSNKKDKNDEGEMEIEIE